MRGFCTICETPFSANLKDVSAIGCGHVFHNECLVIWSTQKKSCPQCKTKLTTTTGEITRLHFCCIPSETIEGDPRMLKAKINKLEKCIEEAQMAFDYQANVLSENADMLQKKNADAEELRTQIDKLQKKNADVEELRAEIVDMLQKKNAHVEELRAQIDKLQKKNADVEELRTQIDKLQKKNADVEEKAKKKRDELLEELVIAKNRQAEEQSMHEQEKLYAQIDILQKKNADIEENAKKEMDGLLEELANTKQTVTEYQERFDAQKKCLDELSNLKVANRTLATLLQEYTTNKVVLNKTTTTAKNPAVDEDSQNLKTCSTILKPELLKSKELIKIKYDQTEEQLKRLIARIQAKKVRWNATLEALSSQE